MKGRTFDDYTDTDRFQLWERVVGPNAGRDRVENVLMRLGHYTAPGPNDYNPVSEDVKSLVLLLMIGLLQPSTTNPGLSPYHAISRDAAGRTVSFVYTVQG